MIREAFVMQLHAGQVEEYRRRHNPIWPELERTLRGRGVREYSIFLHPETLQLFACAQIESKKRLDTIAQTAICQGWWAHMRGLMKTNDDHSPASTASVEVFGCRGWADTARG